MDLLEVSKNKNRHPWEISRCSNIIKIIRGGDKDITDALNNGEVLDIGAGDRYFDHCLLKYYNNITINCVDINYSKSEKDNCKNIKIYNDISCIKDKSISLLIMMDVLEHIEDDSKFLSDVLKKVKDNGVVLVTVPAHQFLYSNHDAFIKHYRRYSQQKLNSLLSQFLYVKSIHYFYCSLFLARVIIQLKEKIFKEKIQTYQSAVGYWKFSEHHFITNIYKSILNFDFFICNILNKINIKIYGLSLISICKKKDISIKQ